MVLKFGTSGLRGLVVDMTDHEVFVNTLGFLHYLSSKNELSPSVPVMLAEDLRAEDPKSKMESSPRIARAAAEAIRQAGLQIQHCGQVPTPAVASWALQKGAAAVMVTGSHIPADRNGVKFYRPSGEILKSDEAGILEAVQKVRAQAHSQFDEAGFFKEPQAKLTYDSDAQAAYVQRYTSLFEGQKPLQGQKLVVYQHSAVGRDILVEVLSALGAEVLPRGRSDVFVAVDTEDVTVEDEQRYANMVQADAADALLSTDGDGDRPLIVDEQGRFHRGDVVGAITSEFLGADFAAIPVSTSDAVDLHFKSGLVLKKTRIGSPYVIDAMTDAIKEHRGVVGWEANGGFLTATSFSLGSGALSALPTRDAMLPILSVLLAAAQKKQPVSALFAALPARATRAGLLDDFPRAKSLKMIERLTPDSKLESIEFQGSTAMLVHKDGAQTSADAASFQAMRETVEKYFDGMLQLGKLLKLNYVDGIRMTFDSGDIAHLRPSGNAPQLRLYTVASTQARADEIIDQAIAEPDGLLRCLERDLGGE